MPYRYLEDVAIADLAFEAEGESLNQLFSEAVLALTAAMVEPDTLKGREKCRLSAGADELDTLLFRTLSEAVLMKDAEQLLFLPEHAEIVQTEAGYKAVVEGKCDRIDPKRQKLRTDVKAVTLHDLSVGQKSGKWVCRVTLDV
ncbi:MAG: archease [Thermoprotei archaeon]